MNMPPYLILIIKEVMWITGCFSKLIIAAAFEQQVKKYYSS
jgi:hypothetical protein